MKSISNLGLGLCVVFGSLVLALVAELYYLLWWKKKRINLKIDGDDEVQKRSNFSYILHFCRRPSSYLRSTAQELCNSPTLVHEPQSSNPNNKDLWLKRPFAEENMGNFPRFLFTITEETREDLESEDGGFKNRKQSTSRSRSNLSDLLQILETPFLTPIASPPYFTPPLTPSFFEQNLSPFMEWEWERDAEFNRLRASPPPMFKFLRDAEEKMVQSQRRIIGEDEKESGQFITLVIDEKHQGKDGDCCSSNLERQNHQDTCFSSRHR